MQLPLIPDRQKNFTVVEYPSNRQTTELFKVILASKGWPREEKEAIISGRPGLSTDDISEELDARAADMQTAEIVFKEDLPASAEWEDLSQNALQEAIGVFFGVGGGTNGQPPTF